MFFERETYGRHRQTTKIIKPGWRVPKMLQCCSVRADHHCLWRSNILVCYSAKQGKHKPELDAEQPLHFVNSYNHLMHRSVWWIIKITLRIFFLLAFKLQKFKFKSLLLWRRLLYVLLRVSCLEKSCVASWQNQWCCFWPHRGYEEPPPSCWVGKWDDGKQSIFSQTHLIIYIVIQ